MVGVGRDNVEITVMIHTSLFVRAEITDITPPG